MQLWARPIRLLLYIITTTITTKRRHLLDCLACSSNVETLLSVFHVPKDIWRLSLSQQTFPRNIVISVFNSWISPDFNLWQLYSCRCAAPISSCFSCGCKSQSNLQIRRWHHHHLHRSESGCVRIYGSAVRFTFQPSLVARHCLVLVWLLCAWPQDEGLPPHCAVIPTWPVESESPASQVSQGPSLHFPPPHRPPPLPCLVLSQNALHLEFLWPRWHLISAGVHQTPRSLSAGED